MSTRYQFIDDSGETRLAGFLDPDPGGSLVFAAASFDGSLATGDPIPWDSTLVDASGLIDSANDQVKIPVGQAGTYLVGFTGEAVVDVAATFAAVGFSSSTPEPDPTVGLAPDQAAVSSSQRRSGTCTRVYVCVEGDTIQMVLTFDGLTTPASCAAYLWIVKLS